MRTIYFDNNATTKVHPEVAVAMQPFFSELYGNASSIHEFGGKIGPYVKKAREQVAKLVNADEHEIVFTSCGTESNNTVVYSVLNSFPDKKHIITTAVEHPAVLNVCKFMQSHGYKVTYLPVDNTGMISMTDLENALTPDTALVSIMWANNETGVVFPVEKCAEIVKAKSSAYFHTDAVQAAGKVPIDLKNSKIDMLSLSGHKLHAPKGIGILYVRKGIRFLPYMKGGHQEHNRRAGTENVPYIVGLGAACEMAMNNMEEENAKVKEMRDRLEEGIVKNIPDVLVNGGKAPRLPNTLNVSFRYIEGESILMHLSDKGIAASSGSACTSGSLEPSHVLKAMHVPFEYAHGSLRLSLSIYNTMEDVDFFLSEITAIIKVLRELSPFGKQP